MSELTLPNPVVVLVNTLWQSVRRLVPTRFYPLLAPLYRWRRQAHLRALAREDSEYLSAHPGLRVPPAALRYNVVGECTVPQFVRGGEDTVNDIEAALRAVDLSLRQFREFLDFGCGCGRLTPALQTRCPGLKITGCDVDERAIGWCRENINAATFVINGPLPPSPFDDEAFDLIWCGSVFTHLDEGRQNQWLRELHRILRPGGFLLASVHGPRCWEPRLPRWTIARLKREGMIFARTGADAGIHPAWYQVAWHTEEYVRARWGVLYDIRQYIPGGLNGYQDVVVAQSRSENTLVAKQCRSVST